MRVAEVAAGVPITVPMSRTADLPRAINFERLCGKRRIFFGTRFGLNDAVQRCRRIMIGRYGGIEAAAGPGQAVALILQQTPELSGGHTDDLPEMAR